MIVRLICPPKLLKHLEKRGMEFPEKHRPCEELRWTPEHPTSRYGTGVLLRESGEVFTGGEFRFLRGVTRDYGAYIETDEPVRVAHALGIFRSWSYASGTLITLRFEYSDEHTPVGDYSEFGIHDIREQPCFPCS